MEYIFGGYSEKPNQMIEKSLYFFEKRFSESFEFEGLIKNNYFMGIIKEKSKKTNTNIWYFDDCKLFKSLYYDNVPEILINKNKDFDYDEAIKDLRNDFIFAIYDENKGIKIYKDIFAREKVYYTITPPFLFSTSLKLLISLLDNKKFNYKVFGRYLGTGLNIGAESIILQIKRLDLGENLYTDSNEIKIFKTWVINKNFFERSKHSVKDIDYWVEYVYQTFKETLSFPTKQPILSMMSGGLDSTVITSILKREFDNPVEAITVSVPGYNEEDVEKAIEVAEYIDIPHFIRDMRIHDYKELTEIYTEVFNILEEPMGGTAYFSRFAGYNEVKKLNRNNTMIGEGAGEVMSYLRHNVLYNFKRTNYLFHIPRKLRSHAARLLNKFYYPSFLITNLLKDKNTINSIDILMNSNFLETNSEIQTLASSVQFSHMEDVFRITGRRLSLDNLTEINVKMFKTYPFNDYNKFGFTLQYLSPSGDPLISHVLSSYYDLKLYCPYISYRSYQKFLPIPPYLKLTGDGIRTRYKWLVREVAKRKKLLPKKYFDWQPKYGLRQDFFNPDSFEAVKSYAYQLINSLKSDNFVKMKPFKKLFRKATIPRLKKHSSEYMKFNIWLGFLGWFSTI
ncbi:MAG: asparagine synthase-related protein [Candidatus Hodarchaeota archaeon]